MTAGGDRVRAVSKERVAAADISPPARLGVDG